jgi:cell wall-associated NlpC family hydrolase
MNPTRRTRRIKRTVIILAGAFIAAGCLTAIVSLTLACVNAPDAQEEKTLRDAETSAQVIVIRMLKQPDVSAAAQQRKENTALVSAVTEAKQPVEAKSPAISEPVTIEQLAQRKQKALEDLAKCRKPNRMQADELDGILDMLPDGLPLCRALIVAKAFSLLGEVPYEWGGKSSVLGWDSQWGKPRMVVRNGVRVPDDKSAGLDCSGFVRWCFLNAGGTKEWSGYIGSGTYRQWINSSEINFDDALPGDLVFTNPVGSSNHDGIVVQNLGKDRIIVIHCAASKGVVLENARNVGFRFARRPNVLSGKTLESYETSMKRHARLASMADLRYLTAAAEWNAAQR